MARNRGKKALYEVMSKARLKPGYGKTLERMHPKKSGRDKPAADQTSAPEQRKAAVWWLRRPRVVQYNAGRIEFSIPYQLAVALALAVVLLILAAFRLGQYSGPAEQQPARQPSEEGLGVGKAGPTGRANAEVTGSYGSGQSISSGAREVQPPDATGNNVIVLAEYGTLADLGPVQTHFAEYGIETVIVKENNRWFLQTKDTYDNPAMPGTDGYEAMQRIVEVGARYKGRAPVGYESFAPNFFKDAYGKKVK